MAIISAIVSIVALGISIRALHLATQTFRLEHRPLIRVVATFRPQVGVLGGHGSHIDALLLDPTQLLLKNVGRGPGLTVVAFDPDVSALLGDVEVVEPLGPGEAESTRLGRVVLQLRRPMVRDHTYELYYQDVRGAWHLTRFRPRPQKIECTFVGEANKVPAEVGMQGTVEKP